MTESMTEYLECAFQKGGYQVKTKDNMNELMEALFQGEGKKSGNPEFDPFLHELNEHNSLWVEISDENERVVATSAARLLETDDLVELTRSYRLWYGDKIRHTQRLDVVVSPDVVVPRGRLVLDGAMWVRPDQRRKGVSWVLGRLLRATAFEAWEPDWFFGLALPGVTKRRVPIYSYGYPRLDPFVAGYHLPGFVSQDLSLASMSRDEYLANATEDLQLLCAWPDLSVGPELALRIRAGLRNSHSAIETSRQAI